MITLLRRKGKEESLNKEGRQCPGQRVKYRIGNIIICRMKGWVMSEDSEAETPEFQTQPAMKREKQEREMSSLPGVRTRTTKRSSSEHAEYISPGSKVKKMS